jgi:hypothetical protein
MLANNQKIVCDFDLLSSIPPWTKQRQKTIQKEIPEVFQNQKRSGNSRRISRAF